MKAIILSCATGGGHNAAAYALQEAFTARGHQAQVLDYLSLASPRVSKTVGESYVEMVKLSPQAFGAVYDIGMAVSTHVRRSPVYYANASMAGHLREYLAENPVDCILMTHLFAAETLTWMKRHGDKLPLTVAVGTDYTCIPFWEETDCDCYVLPHPEMVAEYLSRGFPRKKLFPLGIPVLSAFSQPFDRAMARKALALDPHKKVYLIVGGSMGAGNLTKLTRELVRRTGENDQLLIICGTNKRKCENMVHRYAGMSRMTVYGRTDKMRLLMAACDVIFTKPGGLTSTEAAVAGIPLVHIDPIPGCETVNRTFFVTHGMSVSGATPAEQAIAGFTLLHDEAALAAMHTAQAACIPHHAAADICRLTEDVLANGGALPIREDT